MGDKFVARVYDAGTAEHWKGQIAMAVREHAADIETFLGPVHVVAEFFFPRPKKHFKADGSRRTDAPKWHTSKPDGDNCMKAVLDALTTLNVWRDDSQVCSQTVRKFYSDIAPGAQITIQDLPPQI